MVGLPSAWIVATGRRRRCAWIWLGIVRLTQGLILTSTRCVRDAIAQTRSQDLEFIKTGFVAASLEQEFRLRASCDKCLTAAQLVKISNVTDEVNKGVAPTDNATQIKEKRKANKKSILDAARNADPEGVPQIGKAARLVQQFKELLRERKARQLCGWLSKAGAANSPRANCNGLPKDCVKTWPLSE